MLHALGQLIHPLFVALAALLAFWYGVVPSYAVAIALFTVTVMVVLAPLTVKSTRSMLAMQALQPEVKKIQTKYKGDKMAQQEELSALFKENKVSPAGGCLPMFLQFPVFIVLYQVIRGLTFTKMVHGHEVAAPKYISVHSTLYHHLVIAGGHMQSLGLDLARSATSVHGGFLSALPFYLILVACIALQYLQMRQLTNRNPQASQANPQMAKIQKFTPLVFGVIYISIPAGVNIYFLVSSVFRIGQQELMYRYDPQLKAHAVKAKAIGAQAGKAIDTTARPREARGSTAPSGGPGRGLLASLRAAREELRANAVANGSTGTKRSAGTNESTRARAGSGRPASGRPSAGSRGEAASQPGSWKRPPVSSGRGTSGGESKVDDDRPGRAKAANGSAPPGGAGHLATPPAKPGRGPAGKPGVATKGRQQPRARSKKARRPR